MKSYSGCILPRALPMLICTLLSLPALAADAMDQQQTVNTRDIKWGDAPPALPKGAKVAVLLGDPGKTGPFVMRLRAPAGYKIPPHWHSQAENLTVISGTFNLGMGEKWDATKTHALSAGGFHHLPPKTNHYAYTKTPTVVQVNGEGPFDITYINPGDDPQKAKK